MSNALLSSLSNAVMHLINVSAIENSVKQNFTAQITAGLSELEQAGSAAVAEIPQAVEAVVASPTLTTVETQAENIASSAVPVVENVAGEVAESTVDAAITSVAGPLSPVVLPEANALLNALGGDLEAAIGQLLHLKQTSPQ